MRLVLTKVLTSVEVLGPAGRAEPPQPMLTVGAWLVVVPPLQATPLRVNAPGTGLAVAQEP
ncbi:hypothetical protein ACQP2P_09640 [Dactylosporangium sp. CA-139114]|uniref:hypothetical protein n=1 Tax=Dactylosporangium sp. CA-139114 TaxID=3239931 RepID=UPI003D960654